MSEYRLIEEIKDPITREVIGKHTEYYNSYEEAYDTMYENLKDGFNDTFQIYSLNRWETVERDIKETNRSYVDDRFFLSKYNGFYKNQWLQEIFYRIEKVNREEDQKKLDEINKDCSSSAVLAVICFLIGTILVITANSRHEFGCTPVSFLVDCIPFIFGFIFLCLSTKKTQDDIDNASM